MNPSGESGQVQWIRFATLPKCKSPHSWMLLANIMLSGIKGKAAQAIWDFANLILDLRERLDQLTITELVEEVLDKTGYMTALTNQGNLESQARIENIQEFLSVTKNFDENGETVEDETGVETLSRFLNDLALIADTDDGAQETSEVTLMTLHAAKGLEFPVVFFDWDGRKRLSS